MKIGKLKRYNHQKRGSYQIAIWMTDWELACLIKALKLYAEYHEKQGRKNMASWARKRAEILGKALGTVLKRELADIKGDASLLEEGRDDS